MSIVDLEDLLCVEPDAPRAWLIVPPGRLLQASSVAPRMVVPLFDPHDPRKRRFRLGIGRHCDIPLRDPSGSIGVDHAEIIMDPAHSRCWVRDLSSAHGTQVRAPQDAYFVHLRGRSQELRDFSLIRLGAAEAVLCVRTSW